MARREAESYPRASVGGRTGPGAEALATERRRGGGVGGRTGPGRRQPTLRCGYGAADARRHRHSRELALPRRDDVRRLGRARPRRGDPHRPPGAGWGDQLHRHRRRLFARGVRGDRRQGAGRWAARARGACDQVPRHDGRRSQPGRQLAALDLPGGRVFAAAPEDGLDRPLPGAPLGPVDRSR